MSGIHALDWAIGCVLVIVVLKPVTSLVHELGHALVAVAAGCGRVRVIIGRERPALRLGPLPTSGVLHGGLCVRMRQAPTLQRELAVVLAGPAATLLCAATLGVLATHAGPPALAATLALGALECLVSLVLNLDARDASGHVPATLHRDGQKAIAIVAAMRRGAGPEALSPGTWPFGMPAPVPMRRYEPGRSVPPPGHPRVR